MKKEKRYCNVDHANTQLDRLRKKPNRASKKRAKEREAAASTHSSGATDSATKGG